MPRLLSGWRSAGFLLAASLLARTLDPQSNPPGPGPIPPTRTPWPGIEGPLDNSVFQGAVPELDALLAEGDAALLRARTQPPAKAGLEWAACFEAWRAALESAEGAGEDAQVRAADGGWMLGDPTRARRTLGPLAAVQERLAALSESERRQWSERFTELAESRRAAAGRERSALARVDRSLPATPAAARAALALFELEFESGSALGAATWLERARAQLALLGSVPDLEDAWNSRRQAFDTWWPKPLAAPEALWSKASALEPRAALALGDPQLAGRAELGGGIRPGLCWLADGRIAVHSLRGVSLYRPDASQELASFVPSSLLPGEERLDALWGATREAPGWALLPCSDGERLLLVEGRGEPGRSSNRLILCWPPSGDQLVAGPGALPRLAWAWRGAQRVLPTGALEPEPELAQLGPFEWQPGPVFGASLVLAQLRSGEGEQRAWLVALDADSGALLWKRFLAKGFDWTADQTRMGANLRTPGSSQPLKLVPNAAGGGGLSLRVFAGTNLGNAVLLESLDGRVDWSLQNRRRPIQVPALPGWTGARPLATPQTLLWAPPDSDRLYRLDLSPAWQPRSLFALPPEPEGAAELLLDADLTGSWVLERSGSKSVLVQRGAQGSSWRPALELGSAERPSGEGLVGGQRLLLPSRRSLYLFDTQRDGYLLAAAAFEAPRQPRSAYSPPPNSALFGGDVYARGELVLVLGSEALWSFRAR